MKRSFQLWILSITLRPPFEPECALLLFLHKNHEPVLKRCFLLSCSSTKYDQTFQEQVHNLYLFSSSQHVQAASTVTSQSTPSTCSVPCHLKLSQNKHHFPFWTGPYFTQRIWLANNAVWFMNADRCQHVGVFVNEHNSRRLDLAGCLYFGYIAIEQEGYRVQT